jgi:histidyl-tRNA synthetase
MKIDKCKGMRDLFPVDMEKFRLINEIFRDSCLKWGYEEVRTPTLEYLHLFTSAGMLTPGMLGKVYSFLDWDGWSGERVVLRPDATIPVARLYIEKLADRELAKLFYVVNTFIFEETGKKNREKWQAGAELIGMGSPLADVELIVLALEVLRRLGIPDVKLKLSHAGLTRGVLQKLALNPAEQARVFDQLLDGDATALTRIKAEKPALAPLLALQGKSAGFIKNLASTLALDLPEFKPQIDDFVFIAGTLQSLGYDFQIDLASIQGFEYYTGVIFQLFSDDAKVGGGGRYDALIPAMGGQKAPASGFALYIDTLMELAQTQNARPVPRPAVAVTIEEGAYPAGFDAAKQLRDAGLSVKFHLGGKGPSGADWKLDVRQRAPNFVLTDTAKGRKFELNTIAAVLEKLGYPK